MGTLFVIFVTLLAAANGILLTYLVVERMSLPGRLSAGAVVGLALLSWIAFLLSLLLGLNPISIVLTVVIIIAGLMTSYRFIGLRMVREELHGLGFDKSAVIYYAVWATLLAWLFSRVMMFYPDGMHTAPANNFGDLPFHFSVITSFAYGENLPPENPIFAGMKFTYPFLIDFLTAFFMRCGADWRSAFFVENMMLSLSLVGLIACMAGRLVNHRMAARLAPVLFFFNGGFGFINFFHDVGRFLSEPGLAKMGLIWLLTHLPNTYTMNADLILSIGKIPLRWGNVFTTLLIPQRSMLFGLPFVALIMTLWWMAVGERESGGPGKREIEDEKIDVREQPSSHSFAPPRSRAPALPLTLSRRYLFAAGILTGLLPMLHAHGFFAVAIASVAMVMLYRTWDWLAFFAPVMILAGPQAWWLSGTQVKDKLFEAHLWWEAGALNPLIFWAANAGVFILLLLVALTAGKLVSPRVRRFYLPLALWFIAPNIILLAPWPWDNIKVLIYWSLASCPLVAAALASLFNRRTMILRGLAVALLIALTFSGGLDVLRALSPAENVALFGRDELEVAALLREKTPPHSVILHAPIHNSVVALSGRRSVMGYPGHLWTHGIEYRQRESEVKSIYRGGPGASGFLARLNVDYLIVGPVERSQMAAAEADFASQYPMVINHGAYRVYQIKQ
jgi:hypothetical protein